MPRRHRLTLVEIVATLVVVGVVGAFLHEQGAQREAERRSVALDGLAGSVRASAALAHSMWIADGADSDTVATAAGRTVDIDLLTGYPRATDDGIRGLVPALDGIAVERTGDRLVFSISGVPARDCNVTYVTGRTRGATPQVTVRNNATGGDCS